MPKDTFPHLPSDHPILFWKNLQRIQDSMGLGDWDFAHYLGMKAHEYHRSRRETRDLSARAVFRLLDHIPLSFERFMKGEIDFEAIHAHVHGNTAYVPSKYMVGARSRRRTSLNVLAYLAEHYGEREKNAVLKHFSMNAAAFKDPDAPINVHFASELCTFLVERGYPHRALFEMGAHSTAVNQGGPLGALLSQGRSVVEVYQRIFDELIARFDENFEYRLMELTRDRAVVRVTEKSEARDELRQKHFGSEAGCVMRGGVIAAFPGYIGLGHAAISHTACIHRGDLACVYELDFSGIRGPR